MTLEEGKREIDQELQSFVHSLPRSKSGDIKDLIERLKNMQKSVEAFKYSMEPKINDILSEIQVEDDKVDEARTDLEAYLYEITAETMNNIISR